MKPTTSLQSSSTTMNKYAYNLFFVINSRDSENDNPVVINPTTSGMQKSSPPVAITTPSLSDYILVQGDSGRLNATGVSNSLNDYENEEAIMMHHDHEDDLDENFLLNDDPDEEKASKQKELITADCPTGESN